ncbi:hypothetical protein FRB93_001181 [Tulasnella sp. JGI-2019a]|nr:hypothetical protein FRB93_001181 [Tulasnella sp. JGI-2019a]
MIKINLISPDEGSITQPLMSGTSDTPISELLASVGNPRLRSFTMRDGRYKTCRWEDNTLSISETPHHDLIVVDGPSDYHGKDSTLKINRNDSFAKA